MAAQHFRQADHRRALVVESYNTDADVLMPLVLATGGGTNVGDERRAPARWARRFPPPDFGSMQRLVFAEQFRPYQPGTVPTAFGP